jgi:hypothetical protein
MQNDEMLGSVGHFVYLKRINPSVSYIFGVCELSGQAVTANALQNLKVDTVFF